MPKYIVTLSETVHYRMYVEAENEDEATDMFNGALEDDPDMEEYDSSGLEFEGIAEVTQ